MKKVILNLAVTLDGFIEGPHGEIDWCILDDDMQFGAFLDSVDTVIFGRVSYEAWGNYRPDDKASASELNFWETIQSKKQIVVSHQQPREAEGVTYISGDIEAAIREMKQQGGKDIWLFGGANLITTFLNSGLIDLYNISVHPTLLGSGKPLFENLKHRTGLRFTGSRAFRSGVVELSYESL